LLHCRLDHLDGVIYFLLNDRPRLATSVLKAPNEMAGLTSFDDADVGL